MICSALLALDTTKASAVARQKAISFLQPFSFQEVERMIVIIQYSGIALSLC